MTERRYRIAMVAPGPFPTPRGSQVLVRELAEALVAAGHAVHIVAFGGGDDRIPVIGASVHRTPQALGRRVLHGPRAWRVVLNALLLWRLYRVVKQEHIDVIHAHNYEGPVVAYAVRALTGVPVVYHGHNVMSDELARYFRGRIGRWIARAFGLLLDRIVPRQADYVVALSEPMAAFLRDRGVPGSQLAVIPPGVSVTEDLQLSDAGSDLYPGAKVILYAGNLDPYQDLPVLVEAFAAIRRQEPTAILVLATHDVDAIAEREISRLRTQPSVRVQRAKSFQEVRQLLHRADVVVCPRTSWSGFPIKLLNYMAAGRAIVAAAGAACAVEDGPMIVVPDGDVSGLSSAVVAALRDPTRREDLGRRAKLLARSSFSWPSLVPKIIKVYGVVVETGQNGAGDLQQRKKMLQKATAWELIRGTGSRLRAARPGVG